jgi:hypothetical protein
MSSRNIISIVINFLLFVGLQWLVARNLDLYHTAFCFLYVGFILLLPLETNPLVVLLIAFGTGLATDMFYDTLGMHAAASVLVAYLRHTSLKVLTPAGGYEDWMEVSLPSMGPRWYLQYSLPLLFLHSLALFMLEYSNWQMTLLALGKAAASTLFTFVIILVVQYASYRPARGI